MTNEELKKKIVEVVLNSEITGIQIRAITGGYSMANNIADALIAAGIGDVKRHRVFVSKDGKEVKQFYSGEEVENILKERNELKVELRDKVDYIHEQDEVIKEYKHRAARAERAPGNACEDVKMTVSFLIELSERVDGLRVEGYLPEESEPKAYINRAEAV